MLVTSSFVLNPVGKKRPRREIAAERSTRRRVVNPNHPLEYMVTIPGGRRSSCLRYMYEVLDAFETPDDGTGASLQTLELATSLFDRYMASLAQPFMDRENLELLCVACVSLGTKFHEVQSYLVTDSYYLANEAERNHVVAMESRILAAIQWNVRLKNSLVEDVFDMVNRKSPRRSDKEKEKRLVRRAFKSVWIHTYFVQGFSATDLASALASIVLDDAKVDDFCARQILRAVST